MPSSGTHGCTFCTRALTCIGCSPVIVLSPSLSVLHNLLRYIIDSNGSAGRMIAVTNFYENTEDMTPLDVSVICSDPNVRFLLTVTSVDLVGWLCLTSHRQRGHLETAPPFTVPCEGREAR